MASNGFISTLHLMITLQQYYCCCCYYYYYDDDHLTRRFKESESSHLGM